MYKISKIVIYVQNFEILRPHFYRLGPAGAAALNVLDLICTAEILVKSLEKIGWIKYERKEKNEQKQEDFFSFKCRP